MMCEQAESALFQAGTLVCRRGQVADSMFFIVTGELDVDAEMLAETFGLSAQNENDCDIVSRLVIRPNQWVGDQSQTFDPGMVSLASTNFGQLVLFFINADFCTKYSFFSNFRDLQDL